MVLTLKVKINYSWAVYFETNKEVPLLATLNLVSLSVDVLASSLIAMLAIPHEGCSWLLISKNWE